MNIFQKSKRENRISNMENTSYELSDAEFCTLGEISLFEPYLDGRVSNYDDFYNLKDLSKREEYCVE